MRECGDAIGFVGKDMRKEREFMRKERELWMENHSPKDVCVAYNSVAGGKS